MIEWFSIFGVHPNHLGVSQGALVVKKLPANAGDIKDVGSIPGSGRSPGDGNGNLLQYSCLKDPTDRGAWQATVLGVTQNWTQLKRLSTHVPTLYLVTLGGPSLLEIPEAKTEDLQKDHVPCLPA